MTQVNDFLADLLTPKQAAALLGLSAWTMEVWRATKRYPLPYIKVGASVRYRRQDILKFLESRLVDPQPTPKLRRRKHSV